MGVWLTCCLSFRLPFIFITIYGVCVQLAHFTIGDWKDISIAHVIIIIKSEVSTFPIVIKFFCGCVSEMFVTSYYVTSCIYIPGKPGIYFHYHCAGNTGISWCVLRCNIGLSLLILQLLVYFIMKITPDHRGVYVHGHSFLTTDSGFLNLSSSCSEIAHLPAMICPLTLL